MDRINLAHLSEILPKDAGRAPVADFGCPRCGGLLLTKGGRFGDFKGCENYPECRYTETIPGQVKR